MYAGVVLVILSLIASAFCNLSCHQSKQGMINVHLVCHTHDDVGWLKTVDQYYYGSNKGITWVGVQYILDSVIPSLLKDPTRKFIYVESAFFSRWWNEQDDAMKARVQNLVQNGQLEFVSGGWSMNDEATTHYNALIDQMTVGLTFLKDTFGDAAIPTITWQIDPFGHSIEQASIFAQMGMDALFLGRLDYDDKAKRWNDKQMEMVWKASQSLGEAAWIFTGVLPNNYSPPSGFCFDIRCNDDPIMDDPRLEDNNVEKMVDNFLTAVADQQVGYATSNLIMTMGDDFNYMNAESWFKNLDKLIKYVNERQNSSGSNVNVMYSTPSCYLAELQASNMTWPTKSDDFFPYASDPHAFWTGYFTSRPTFKGYVRQTNNYLQASKQIAALSGSPRDSFQVLAEVAGVIQHHDAVTGTEKQHVTDDYSRLIYSATVQANAGNADGLRSLIPQSTVDTEFASCPLLNISACPFTENLTSFIVNVYNPLGRSLSSYIRVPVTNYFGYIITDSQGATVESQAVLIPQTVADIPGRDSLATFEIVFYAQNLPPLGVAQFKFINNETFENIEQQRSRNVQASPLSGNYVIENENLRIAFDANSKLLKFVEVKTKSGVEQLKLNQEWMWYSGMAGDNFPETDRASGAYIFRPDGDVQSFGTAVQNISVVEGPVVSEVVQIWSDYVSQVLRLYKNSTDIELEWLIGPIPIDDGIGKEVINRLRFDEMVTNDTFYTDANGREMQKRINNHRNTWTLESTEPISQNYYPVTSRIMISSINGQGSAAILNDRSQGGTSRADGQMELMVHRRLLYDDGKGVGEALNERAYFNGLVVRGKHHILHSSFATVDCDFDCLQRNLAEELLLKPMLTFSSLVDDQQQMFTTTGLQSSLPNQIHLLTLEPWGVAQSGQWLLRLENYFELSEGGVDVVVDLENLFADWTIVSAEEMMLGANQLKSQNSQLQWETHDQQDSQQRGTNVEEHVMPKAMAYSFSPMQIRTFILNVTLNA